MPPLPQFTAVDFFYSTGGYEAYRSFQLKVNKQLSHNLSALASFAGQQQNSIISNMGNSAGSIQTSAPEGK